MPAPTSTPSPPEQQFDRSNDPAEAREMERHAAELAMRSEHQAFAGAARHVGGVEFDDPGVFEIDEEKEDPDALIAAGAVSGGPLETGREFRTEAEVRGRDPGEAAGSLSPDQPDTDLGGAPAPNVVAPQQGAAEMSARKDDREPDRASARREWKGDSTDQGPDELYNPSEVGATRMRMQGLGMGEEELRMQRDPTRERHLRSEIPGGEPEAQPPQRPDKRQ